MIENIYRYGKYYNPAKSHYPYNQNSIVNCDKCNKSNLPVCIGWNDLDLCLGCVDIISKRKDKFNCFGGLFDPTIVTNMMVSNINPDKQITYMAVSNINPFIRK